MTDRPGQDIYEAMKSISAFYGQVALLLQTAEAYLVGEERGFKPMFGSTALAEGTASINHPTLWLPHTAFRFFAPPRGAETVATFVSVIMAPVNPEQYQVAFTEPLVSAGWVRYHGPVPTRNLYWWSRLILYSDAKRDGVARHHWISEDGQPGQHGNVELLCFALPLMEIKDSEALVKMVLKPLIDSLPSAGGEFPEPT